MTSKVKAIPNYDLEFLQSSLQTNETTKKRCTWDWFGNWLPIAFYLGHKLYKNDDLSVNACTGQNKKGRIKFSLSVSLVVSARPTQSDITPS